MRTWLEKIWYSHSSPPLLLRPLSWLYAALIAVRYYLYRKQWLKTGRVSVPVIVVGNLTLGGAGKTPLVSYLARTLQSHGKHVAVISRGYGRQHSGDYPVHRVSADMTAEMVGDEPLMLARQLTCPVWVGQQRWQVAQACLAACPEVDVLLCDDGLQHYALARDIEIVVLDAARAAGNQWLLPAGPLREPLSRLRSVDYLVVNGRESTTWPWLPPLPKANMELQVSALRRVNQPEQTAPLSLLANQTWQLVAGIGNPQRFVQTVASLNQRHQLNMQLQVHTFADHHPYTQQDFKAIQHLPILMTEKDAVKCQAMDLPQAWYLSVNAEVSEDLVEWLLSQLKQE